MHTFSSYKERRKSFIRKISMDLSNREITSYGLLEAQAHIWNHMFNYLNSMSLTCAVQLGIPDIIHNHHKPITLSDLTNALSTHPSKVHCVRRLMRILVHSGFFVHCEKEGYSLTPSSRLLLKDEPLSMAPFLLGILDPILTEPGHFMSKWFQTDVHETPFEMAHGKTFWEYTSQEPRLNDFFNQAMASDTQLVMSIVVRECEGVFKGMGSLVDVGGGTGNAAKAIVEAFLIKCIVLDLPHVVAELQPYKNLNYVGGDMFAAIPPADLILLKWILHDWNDKESVRILKRGREAITKGGKLVIIDISMGNGKRDNESTETQHLFDILMMVTVTGKERNEEEWAKLFFEAGFSRYTITPILGLRSLIEVFP